MMDDILGTISGLPYCKWRVRAVIKNGMYAALAGLECSQSSSVSIFALLGVERVGGTSYGLDRPSRYHLNYHSGFRRGRRSHVVSLHLMYTIQLNLLLACDILEISPDTYRV